jgi:hypothetical protein
MYILMSVTAEEGSIRILSCMLLMPLKLKGNIHVGTHDQERLLPKQFQKWLNI